MKSASVIVTPLPLSSCIRCGPLVRSKISNGGPYWAKRQPVSVRIGVSQHGRSFGGLVKRRRGASMPVFAVFERFTERSITALIFAQKAANIFGRSEVEVPHLLLGLIEEESDSAHGFLGSGLKINKAREVARVLLYAQHIVKGSDRSPSDIPFSSGCKRVFKLALEHCRNTGHSFVSPEHIALAMFSLQDGRISFLLESLHLQQEKLASVAASRMQGEAAKEGRKPISISSQPAMPKTESVTEDWQGSTSKEKGPLLDFCLDITALAREGKVDPLVGREQEVERVVQILVRKTKNNPILLGEPGVGKTAIAEGLALRIIEGQVPIDLQRKRVMSLDTASLMAGSKERGELEARVISLINEIDRTGDVILVIDEVHTIVQSRKGRLSNIANLLKPSISRGQLQCIAATTIDEYRKYVEADKAFARRFQPIEVREPSQEDAVKILNGLLEKYEKHHKCRFTQEAVNAAVELSKRYIGDRYLPDKAIDLIDEAGSRAQMKAWSTRKDKETNIFFKSPAEYWQAIRDMEKLYKTDPTTNTEQYPDKLGNGSNQNMTPSDVHEDSDPSDAGPSTKNGSDSSSMLLVGQEGIANITSAWPGIPSEELASHEKLKLPNLENGLQTCVIGQYNAINAIVRAVRRARVGARDPERPIASLLFCGLTGFGKAEMAKALATIYFGSEAAMITLDMSKYMERDSVSRLIGSPPGYVGYSDGGTLTEAVRQKPFAIILFDEIEKAHYDVYNMILQVFEDGHLSDPQGRQVSFKNTVIIMTSNIGSAAIAKSMGRGLVFTPGKGYALSRELKCLLMQDLRKYFPPELINSVDELVVFRELKKSQVQSIVELMLKETAECASREGIILEVSEAVLNLISKEGYDQRYGTWPLQLAITHLVDDLVSDAMVTQEYQPGDTVLVDLDVSGRCVVHHIKSNNHDQGIFVPVQPSEM